MAIIVSACLLGENCKYNGGNNKNDLLLEFLKDKDVIPVCPECAGGLSTPRTPSEILGAKVFMKDGRDVTSNYEEGARLSLQKALDSGLEIEYAILQPRSPSCGARQIYDGTFSKKLIDGQGVFAKFLTSKGIKTIDVDELF